ncbi:MAG: hypothetical protein M3P30_08070 [Chloroflexota bacterium]|nr:hypothetical protein [Chloroflexota bacterium]
MIVYGIAGAERIVRLLFHAANDVDRVCSDRTQSRAFFCGVADGIVPAHHKPTIDDGRQQEREDREDHRELH